LDPCDQQKRQQRFMHRTLKKDSRPLLPEHFSRLKPSLQPGTRRKEQHLDLCWLLCVKL
jgi:hypothetical protein